MLRGCSGAFGFQSPLFGLRGFLVLLWAGLVSQACAYVPQSADFNSTVESFDELWFAPCPGRIGEASHPGPAEGEVFQISTSNPSGLRNKESQVIEWGPGIHCLSETQYSEPTFRAAKRSIVCQGRQQDRLLRVYAGHPAALRPNSSWAGTWTGVATVSDFPSRPVQIPWEDGAFFTGRVQLTQHYVGPLCVTVGNLYGFPKGPTYPDALSRTNKLLSNFTREVVLGLGGPRVTCGDYNHCAEDLEQVRLWQHHGWVELQTLAECRWHQPPVPTCKNATFRDFVFLSPEAAAICCKAEVRHCFMEHSTVVAGFAISLGCTRSLVWPMPAELPWGQVEVDKWHRQATHAPVEADDPTVFLRQFGKNLEQSLDGFVKDRSGGRLAACCYGRGGHHQPAVQVRMRFVPKASREGEESPAHALLGAEAKRWFQQLRRLQSMKHATAAGNASHSAVEYRISLWRAIVQAKGFSCSFAAWWLSRPVQLQGSPHHLPLYPPSAALCAQIFCDYRENFRRFEAWHARRRGEVLRAKHEASSAQLYRELRAEQPPQVDTVTLRREYAILAVDPEGKQVCIDPEPDVRGTSCWLLDGVKIPLLVGEDRTCTVLGPFAVSLESELKQVQTLSSASDIQDEFVQLWAPRWIATPAPSAEAWDRILGFARAFVQRHNYVLPPLTVTSWTASVRRFKPRAARGPDGFAKADLLHLPECRVRELVGLLNRIEAGTCGWPLQLLTGLVISLSKQNQRTDCQAYRPIVLFSILYRSWAGLRARQLLRFLSHHTSQDAYGFLPTRAASHMWAPIQLAIEQACQQGHSLFGVCTDVVKAFNALPREPLFATMQILGMPQAVVGAWQSFLGSVERRFVVRQQASMPVHSNRGFPEGDPLSTVAMATADLLFHLYLEHFVPSARSLSYVDNFSCLTSDEGTLAHGIVATQTFCDALQLELDSAKTYVWAVKAEDRKRLRPFQLPVMTTNRELGGLMSYGTQLHSHDLVTRCQQLERLWPILARSAAPLARKLFVLPTKFWSSALHGASGSPFAESHLQKLRSAATKALGIRPAGASSTLRLCLSKPPEADPGFYQLLRSLLDFQMECLQCPGFFQGWASFLQGFDGRFFQGPCSKVLQVCSQIGWSWNSAQQFQDEEGLVYAFLDLPKDHLRRLALRAFLRWVACKHRHRKTMSDLHGINVELTFLDRDGFSALDTARLAALQSGAFITSKSHSKYDLTQSGKCELCVVDDTVEHRVCHCPRFEAARQPDSWVCDLWPTLPTCLTHHLLVAESPLLVQLRAALHALPSMVTKFGSVASTTACQHLFTDGSCFWSRNSDLALAAWAVINATTGATLACGPLHGQVQTVARAELAAVLSACTWAIKVGCQAIIWCDSKHVCDGLAYLLTGADVPRGWDNKDLWCQIHRAVDGAAQEALQILHVPSHLDANQCDSLMEDWIAHWNARADDQARISNQNRDYAFSELHGQARAWVDQTTRCVRALRGIYLRIAEATQRSNLESEVDLTDLTVSEGGEGSRPGQLVDHVSICWRELLRSASCKLPVSFVEAVLDLLWSQDANSHVVFEVSFLELLFVIKFAALDHAVTFPVRCACTGNWVSADAQPFHDPHQTVTVQLRLLREALRFAFCRLGLTFGLIEGLDRVALGVFMPLAGLRIGFDELAMCRARSALADFSAVRPIRTLADLARPL